MYSGIMYGNCFIPYIKYQIDVDVHVVPSSPVRGPMNVQCIDCVAYTIVHIFVRRSACDRDTIKSRHLWSLFVPLYAPTSPSLYLLL